MDCNWDIEVISPITNQLVNPMAHLSRLNRLFTISRQTDVLATDTIPPRLLVCVATLRTQHDRQEGSSVFPSPIPETCHGELRQVTMFHGCPWGVHITWSFSVYHHMVAARSYKDQLMVLE